MSWEEDVAKRRWAYFLARRREFEDTPNTAQTPNEAKSTPSSMSCPSPSAPPPTIFPHPAHEARGQGHEGSVILEDEVKKAVQKAAAISHWIPDPGAGVTSSKDKPAQQNLISLCHQTSLSADVLEFARETPSLQMECLSEMMTFPKEEDPLVHACLCTKSNCHVMCNQLKRLICHLMTCPERGQATMCNTCNWMEQLFAMHMRICDVKDCPLPCCRCHRG